MSSFEANAGRPAKSAAGTNRPSAWSRLSRRLDEDSEGYGPIRGTLGTGRIGMIWLAANLVVTTLLTGTLFVPGVTWPTAVGMIVLGGGGVCSVSYLPLALPSPKPVYIAVFAVAF